jgi:hypothetical protein
VAGEDGDRPAGHEESGHEESEDERLTRNFSELLQELRVAQAGVQFLFGFLLAVASPGPARAQRRRRTWCTWSRSSSRPPPSPC